ncbi:hypothetical protein MN032_04050 [Agromyces atrinae]|uniref:hypothetical protein n=1 Tax=Agromyces atrinae TaxID=592376 RepID=UPI001F59BA68|nr:hypothetical protein [Agromyces atrinae]MCI2956856.1 hypothetical protein [Agromyces atrinae]
MTPSNTIPAYRRVFMVLVAIALMVGAASALVVAHAGADQHHPVAAVSSELVADPVVSAGDAPLPFSETAALCLALGAACALAVLLVLLVMRRDPARALGELLAASSVSLLPSRRPPRSTVVFSALCILRV